MGAGAALDFATRDSGLDAVVLISGGWSMLGPQRPPNVLFLYAAGDPERIKTRTARARGAARRHRRSPRSARPTAISGRARRCAGSRFRAWIT